MQVNWPVTILLLGALAVLGIAAKFGVEGAAVAAFGAAVAIVQYFLPRGVSKSIPPPPPEPPVTKREVDQ